MTSLRMGRTFLILIVSLLGGFFLVVESLASGIKTGFVNVESAPLKLEVNSETGFVNFHVESPGRITAYTFGCVSGNPDHLRQKKRLKRQQVDLEKNDYFLNEGSLAALRRQCGENERAAIVEVEFGDGARWQLRR